MANSKVVFKLNSAGVRELLNCKEMESIIVNHAARVANNAGEGYTAAQPHYTGQRVAINVYPKTREAAVDNLNNNTLLKALH